MISLFRHLFFTQMDNQNDRANGEGKQVFQMP